MTGSKQYLLVSVLIILHSSYGLSQSKTQPKTPVTLVATANQRSTNSPNFQSGYAMAYNKFQKKIIGFGGRTGFPDFNEINETWAYDYEMNSWTNLNPSKSPPWRSNHTMVYDEAHKRILLFGGNDFDKVFNDLWEYSYDENTWVRLSPTNPPAARQMHGMAYIPDEDAFVLFGGRGLNGGASFNDLWKFDLSTNQWQELSPATSPPVQDHVAITYDMANRKVIMYADNENNNPTATWSYDFTENSWSNLKSKNTPSADHCKLAYDEQNIKSILLSGKSTWMFDYIENSWTNITSHDFPEIKFTSHPVIEHDAMVYLSDRNLFIQYGGCCSNTTLELIISK